MRKFSYQYYDLLGHFTFMPFGHKVFPLIKLPKVWLILILFPDIFVNVEQICHIQQLVEGMIRNLKDRRARRSSKTIKTAHTIGKQPQSAP